MKVVIIGWYGTETIGDRGILASLIMHLYKVKSNVEISIGSIYPFITERTLLEDTPFYKKLTGKDELKIGIFNSRNSKELTENIKNSDLVIVGGGPLCDMISMYMVEFGVRKAKKFKKKTLIYGCGLGPLYSKEYRKCAQRIVKNSDVAIFRDQKSLEFCNNQLEIKNDKIYVSVDPAVFSTLEYKKSVKEEVSEKIVVNMRDFPEVYSANEQSDSNNINDLVFNIVSKLDKTNLSIEFVGMNYFDAGGDDRVILNEFKYNYNQNIFVYNKPLTLEETMKVFSEAKYCVGMRFHSVVMQTILNGNNYVLDYTDPKIGKIGSFIKQIGGEIFYKNRYICLQSIGKSENKFELYENKFKYSTDIIEKYEKIYIDVLKDLIEN